MTSRTLLRLRCIVAGGLEEAGIAIGGSRLTNRRYGRQKSTAAIRACWGCGRREVSCLQW